MSHYLGINKKDIDRGQEKEEMDPIMMDEG
jgi:hypothetical protein